MIIERDITDIDHGKTIVGPVYGRLKSKCPSVPAKRLLDGGTGVGLEWIVAVVQSVSIDWS